MKKFFAKAGQLFLASTLGYEVAEKYGSGSEIIVKVDSPNLDYKSIDESIDNVSFTNLAIIVLVVIALCFAIIKACLNYNDRQKSQAFEMHELRRQQQQPQPQRQVPIV